MPSQKIAGQKQRHEHMISRFAFRADLAEDIGTGHFKRCLTLAQALQKRGGQAVFAFRSCDGAACAELDRSNIPYFEISPDIGAEREAGFVLEAAPFRPEAVVLDLANHRVFENPGSFTEVLIGYRMAGLRTLVIDGFREHALRGRVSFSADFTVTPYIGAVVDGDPSQGIHLAGAQYFIAQPELARFRRSRYASVGDRRVLLTCGGSDPLGFTPKLLAALDEIAPELEVVVVQGPSFSKNLVAEVETAVTVSKHEVRIERQPFGLGPLYAWCDAAIATSGLTKYELAATGTPAVLVSIDDVHADLVEDFTAAGMALDVGVGNLGSFQAAATKMQMLLEDPDTRRIMTRRGLDTFDGEGADRLLDFFCEEIHV